MAMTSTGKKDCSKLLKKLKKGQEDLKRSLKLLDEKETRNVGRQQLTRRHLAEKPINSLRDVPKKRARVELLSPEIQPKRKIKHPRRFSSTPKKGNGPLVTLPAPEMDSSLEEALLDRPSQSRNTRLPSPQLSKVVVDTSRTLRESPSSRSFLRTSQLKAKERSSSKRGLSVSFIEDESQSRTLKGSKRTLTPKEKGKRLVDSLNASKHGALDQSLSQQKRKFPRTYAGDDPKLGYDWIAGLIDASDSYLSERDDEYFQDLKEFRRVNCSECYKPTESANLVNDPLQPHDSNTTSIDHRDMDNLNCTTCVRSYSLNDRLFPVPRQTAAELLTEEGRGVLETTCPVCEDKHSDSKSPVRYIRVSVPKRTLQSSYQLRPHRRRSFEPNDSMGLSKHCLVGWESAKPAMIPPQPSVGLRDALGKQHLSSADLLNTSHQVEYNLRSRTIK